MRCRMSSVGGGGIGVGDWWVGGAGGREERNFIVFLLFYGWISLD